MQDAAQRGRLSVDGDKCPALPKEKGGLLTDKGCVWDEAQL